MKRWLVVIAVIISMAIAIAFFAYAIKLFFFGGW